MHSFLLQKLLEDDDENNSFAEFQLVLREYKASGQALLDIATKLQELGIEGGEVKSIEDAFCEIMDLDDAMRKKYSMTYNATMRSEVQVIMEDISQKTRALESELKSLLEVGK